MKDPSAFVTEAIARLQTEVPGRTIIAASGGIDSTTAAILAERALGERAHAVFVDTGLLRQGEVEAVAELFRSAGLRYDLVSAGTGSSRRSTGSLSRRRSAVASEPRSSDCSRRKPPGSGPTGSCRERSPPTGSRAGGRSGTRSRRTTTSEGCRRTRKLRLVEPLRDLYKDEVRAVARFLGIPSPDRQPFPGPGLAVRVNGAVTAERVAPRAGRERDRGRGGRTGRRGRDDPEAVAGTSPSSSRSARSGSSGTPACTGRP